MITFKNDNNEFEEYISEVQKVIDNLSDKADKEDIDGLNKIIANFKVKTEDFYRQNRKLNIGVVGQVKAGKSSFLNTLLFDGKEILPKASTPKTATLTKMEYSEKNIIEIEYYSMEEWEVLEENAQIDIDDEMFISARELISMVKKNGIVPKDCIEKGMEKIEFDTYDLLVEHLNDYVGEDGKFTPLVKSVTLYLNKEEFKGLSIVDTPGLNDPIVSRTIRTKEFMEVCDVVFFLSQSGSFLDKSDWNLLSTQLPQKGVKKLVLIASKYDSGIRDILRKRDEDDIFEDENDDSSADNIPKACKIIRKKLRKRAKSKVAEFIEELEFMESTPELIAVIKECEEPVMVSSLVYNMTNKSVDEYGMEELNIYNALKQFSENIREDMKLLGNFEEVKGIFSDVVKEKEQIFENKAKNFIPNAKAELRFLLESYKEKTVKRLAILNGNDREELLKHKRNVEKQIGNIKASITTVFGEFSGKLESEKANGVRELREASKDYAEVNERIGSVTKTGTYTTGALFWKKKHYYTYQENYSYCLAADAMENLRKYSIEATNKVEEVFTEAIQIKEVKRKIMNVVVDNFDMASEDFDSALFKIMVEETVNTIEFPIFDVDISKSLDGISAKFTGELTAAEQKTELSVALQKAITKLHNELCDAFTERVRLFKEDIKEIGIKVQDSLLENINKEFEELLLKCENKENEINKYVAYIENLDVEIDKI